MPTALLEVNRPPPTSNGSSAATAVNGYLDGGAASTSFLSVGSTVVDGLPNLEGKDVVQQVSTPITPIARLEPPGAA
ncbi:hypothetical protein EXIGLDRAFT_502596 [Exidia glandulosa HHB12029]|uniref:Uncharacterized protein n=1 Tax=Exidia glandulosa HHB12029 TaxID=1314781 RepID=A0A166N725_EXIGL|nr:hypothetical protein EXIGLDRAFT_502596 [Exidia glandulosa HHB12029]